MEILKPGKTPLERQTQAKCFACKCQFRFKKKEGKEHLDQRERNFVSVDCPYCGETINVSCEKFF